MLSKFVKDLECANFKNVISLTGVLIFFCFYSFQTIQTLNNVSPCHFCCFLVQKCFLWFYIICGISIHASEFIQESDIQFHCSYNFVLLLFLGGYYYVVSEWSAVSVLVHTSPFRLFQSPTKYTLLDLLKVLNYICLRYCFNT